LILQNLGNHYVFLKLLIKRCSIKSNNFAIAFNAFWKKRHLVDKNIQNVLRTLMKNAVLNSKKKEEAVNTILTSLLKKK
jgi:hypothetical protein